MSFNDANNSSLFIVLILYPDSIMGNLRDTGRCFVCPRGKNRQPPRRIQIKTSSSFVGNLFIWIRGTVYRHGSQS